MLGGARRLWTDRCGGASCTRSGKGLGLGTPWRAVGKWRGHNILPVQDSVGGESAVFADAGQKIQTLVFFFTSSFSWISISIF